MACSQISVLFKNTIIVLSGVTCLIVAMSVRKKHDESEEERATRLIRKQTWRQSTKMQAQPREVYGKIVSMREQQLVKQRYPHIHWGVRNLLELFHRKLCHPSHTLLPTADHSKSMCHTNSDSHMSVSSKVVEMHMRHTPLIYVHLVFFFFFFFFLYNILCNYGNGYTHSIS